MALFGFFRARAKPDDAVKARIRAWAEAILGNNPPVTLTISEIDCGDIACPGLETILLVMRAGEATQAAKVKKPMAEVVEADIAEALRYL